MTASYRHPEALASPEWLASHLGDSSLRVVDARFDVRPTSTGALEAVAEHDAYTKAHIPGAVFLDVMGDLSDPQDPTAVLQPDRFEALMARLGISNDTTVVVYDGKGGTWAARLWWALRYYGHDDVRILNGGLRGWVAHGYLLEDQAPSIAHTKFTARIRPELRVDADQVMDAIGSESSRIVDALPEPFFTGKVRLYPTHRSGHIPTAHNVPAPCHLDPVHETLLPAPELARLWAPVGLDPSCRVITYCGGGVFGAFALFALYVIGHENAALYDASWMEWGADPRRPVETGPGGDARYRDRGMKPRRK